MKLLRWISAVWEIFFPPLCQVCETRLAEGESCLCTSCNIRLPRTDQHLFTDNEVEKLFWGKVHVERATSFFYYSKGSDYNRIVHRLKYYGCKELGLFAGRIMASELLQSDFLEGIDYLIPLPLHPHRLKSRGYNQCDWIARGISEVTGIPCRTDVVRRVADTAPQTRQSVFDRLENTRNAFVWTGCESFEKCHFLMIDDVLTTGATLVSCLSALPGEYSIKISVLTLCVAR